MCEGVEEEGVKQEGGTCVYSQPVFYEGLAQTQLADVDHDVVETILAAPLQASCWHPGSQSDETSQRDLGKRGARQEEKKQNRAVKVGLFIFVCRRRWEEKRKELRKKDGKGGATKC